MDGGSSGEEWLQQVVVGGKRKGKAGSCYKRRFNDDQVRSLETMFEEEAKLEPRKKVQLAKELGLQPRQVAIWFQNRRARWKSKQLEREYNALKTSFDGLAQSFDSLEMEKQSLLKQVGKLKEELLEKRVQEGKSCGNFSDDVRSKTPNGKENDQIVAICEGAGAGAEQSTKLNSLSLNEELSFKSVERFGLDESSLMLNIEPANSAPIVGRNEAWLEEWSTDLDSGNFSDQSCCTMEWWDVWA